MKRIGLRRLIERITDNAMMESFLCVSNRSNGEKRRPLRESDKPGYRIQQLHPDERATLKTATSNDFTWRGFK